MLRTSSRQWVSALFAVVLCLQACAKGNTEDEPDAADGNDPPSVPHEGSLSLDLSIKGKGATLSGDTSNYGGAMVYVGLVELNLAVHVAVPVALLQKAATVDPEYTAENTWVWSYDVASGGSSWTGNLTGSKLTPSTTVWSMRVTNQTKDTYGCCTDFEILSGTTASSTAGTWQVYDPKQPTTAAKLFLISYDYKDATDKAMTYVVNSERPATERFGAGSIVSFVVDGDAVVMTYRDATETGQRTIAWDLETKAGSHTDNTGARVCWGPEAVGFINVTCP